VSGVGIPSLRAPLDGVSRAILGKSRHRHFACRP